MHKKKLKKVQQVFCISIKSIEDRNLRRHYQSFSAHYSQLIDTQTNGRIRQLVMTIKTKILLPNFKLPPRDHFNTPH
jgi:hypothetical protein